MVVVCFCGKTYDGDICPYCGLKNVYKDNKGDRKVK